MALTDRNDFILNLSHGIMVAKTHLLLNYLVFQYFDIDEGYSRNASCALSLKSTFLLQVNSWYISSSCLQTTYVKENLGYRIYILATKFHSVSLKYFVHTVYCSKKNICTSMR